jgi:cystinosin
MSQLRINSQRLSTVGLSPAMLGFDLIGSTFSLLQLISDHYYYLGRTTNYLKLSLNAISITFDSVFLLQHYVLYREASRADKRRWQYDQTSQRR